MGVVTFKLGELITAFFIGAVFGFFIGRDPDFVQDDKKKTKEVTHKK